MSILEYNHFLHPPGQVTLPNFVGGAIESGRSLSGVTGAVDISGGGLLTVKYSNIQLGNRSPTALKYWSQLATALNGGRRSIIVPLLTDFIAPVIPGMPLFAGGSPFGDGSSFSDGSLLGASTIAAMSDGAFAVNSGSIVIRMINGGQIVGGEWFGCVHPTKFQRAYCITDVDSSVSNEDGSTSYTVGIRPPLREGIADGEDLNFARPKCIMRLQAGTSIETSLEKYWYSTPTIEFIESFPTDIGTSYSGGGTIPAGPALLVAAGGITLGGTGAIEGAAELAATGGIGLPGAAAIGADLKASGNIAIAGTGTENSGGLTAGGSISLGGLGNIPAELKASGGIAVGGTSTLQSFTPSLKFNDPRNSQYIALIFRGY